MRVAVILPARNEADGIGRVLAEIPRGLVHDLLVVDNGSTDGTADVARRAGARVIAEPRVGYGRACLTGLGALDASVDTVVFLDADHADHPEDLPKLLEPIARGLADLVIGSRVDQAEPGSLTAPQRLGNRLACALLHGLFGQRYTDLGPFRAIRREALAALGMRDERFGWTVEMQAKAARAGLRVVEAPVRYRRRLGRSKISGTLAGALGAGIGILGTIARVALEAQPFPRGPSRRLLIFLKAPVPGQVKTRLAERVGEDAAGALYRACVELTLARLAPFRRDAILVGDPPEALATLRAWLGADWRLWAQQGEALGDRLIQATRRAFAEGATRVVVLGTDSPWIRAEHVRRAFEALERADVVLGPTEDGGYYLIGLSRFLPALFHDIAWSSPSVLAETQARAAALRVRVAQVPVGYDLDRLEDVQRFVSEERRRAPVAPAVETIEALSQRRP